MAYRENGNLESWEEIPKFAWATPKTSVGEGIIRPIYLPSLSEPTQRQLWGAISECLIEITQEINWTQESAGNLTVAGLLLQVNDIIYRYFNETIEASMQNMAKVFNSANQSVNAGATKVLGFDSEVSDSDAFHDNVTNNPRLTIPIGLAGRYLVMVNVERQLGTGTGSQSIAIRLNGNTTIAKTSVPSSTVTVTAMQAMVMRDFIVGDYVECLFFNGGAVAYNVLATSAYSPYFTIAKL